MLGRGVVSARVPGITSQQSFNAEPTTFDNAVFFYNFTGIIGTTWGKSAGRGGKRTDQVLIALYQLNYISAHLFSSWLNNFFRLSNRAFAISG